MTPGIGLAGHERHATRRSSNSVTENHFSLDLAGDMTMKVIFSSYHKIRKSGIAERNVPHVVLPCLLPSIGRSSKVGQKMKEVKPQTTSSIQGDELKWILILRTRGITICFGITTRLYVGCMDADMRSDRLISNHEWPSVSGSQSWNTRQPCWLDPNLSFGSMLPPVSLATKRSSFLRCDMWYERYRISGLSICLFLFCICILFCPLNKKPHLANCNRNGNRAE